MQLRIYRTTHNNQKFECAAHTKSEARKTFRKMTAKRVGKNERGGFVYAIKSKLGSKVRLTKSDD